MLNKHDSADIVMLTVTDTEYNAVQLFYDWEDYSPEGDVQSYQISNFDKDGRQITVIHTKMDEMGMTASAATAMKMIYKFRPKYIIMVGIAAGVARDETNEQIYGDVLVPDIVWNYSMGKFVSPEQSDIIYGDVGFKPRSKSIRIPDMILDCVRKAAKDEENQCHIHIGPMACGSTVVANRTILERQVHSQFGNTIGLDMESYAVAYAALHSDEPKPMPIIIKSICDFANSEKSDDYQKFAAFTSCEFVKLLTEKFLPF